MSEYFEPIETEVGIIFGRDAIYLDDIKFNLFPHKATFFGELNGHLCSNLKNTSKWIS